MSTFVGGTAPEFKLLNENEQNVSLSEVLQKSPVMIAFYPGDFTPVCTKQLCAYQDAYDSFVKHGIQILGISANSPEEHHRFKTKYRFGFHLLSDPGKATAKEYGIQSLFMLGGTSRAIFIVSRAGKILYRHVEPMTLTHRKPGELIQVLDELKRAGAI